MGMTLHWPTNAKLKNIMSTFASLGKNDLGDYKSDLGHREKLVLANEKVISATKKSDLSH